MLPIRNISYLLPMCCSFWEKCINSQKTGLGCSTPLSIETSIYFENRCDVTTSLYTHARISTAFFCSRAYTSPQNIEHKCTATSRPFFKYIIGKCFIFFFSFQPQHHLNFPIKQRLWLSISYLSTGHGAFYPLILKQGLNVSKVDHYYVT